MGNAAITLAWFFADGPDASVPITFDTRAILADIGAQARDLPREGMREASGQFDACVGQILDLPLADVLGAAWSKIGEIRECLESSCASPSEYFTAALFDHEIKSIHRPRIKIYYGKALMANVEFEIELSLRLEAVKLLIRNGRIEELQTGSCSGTGELKWRDVSLAKGSTRELDLPGKIRLP